MKEELKVTDKVHHYAAIGNLPPTVKVITGETKTCWRVEGELYRKSDGRTRGDSWCHDRIVKFCEEREADWRDERECMVQKRRLGRAIGRLRIEYLSADECRAIADLAEAAIKAHVR